MLEMEDAEYGDEDQDDDQFGQANQTKILELIKGYTKVEREDFTNNIMTFANKKDKR